ncbi:protein serine/threonine phosphatase 2C [Moesziomyces antarcticus]|uniref:Protein phosphatase n=1 Tax=Pseudozyma antarctica TaxID=84753 RepID=A0A5C3FHU7_PSEA2|nr:protein serine/threonine phosphatase 2C [Moesziomyces antarcticus]GAK62556.1 protein serine/threonine phosphatase 2C [Moesziomyces antarcticus]SPO43111.1 related to PTC7 - type 2C protein phosphatase [Moesziomyces antarcticus]
MLSNGHATCLRMPGRLAHRSLGTAPRTQLLSNNAALRSISTTTCASVSRRSVTSTRTSASTFAPTLRTAPLRRTLTTSAPRSSQKPFSFLTAYAFQGKPRHSEDVTQEGDSSFSAAADESEASASGAAEDGAKRGQIGFPADSEIGRWRDELLRGGEAGEDSLMCTSMGSAGDVAIGVADGVGGWTENGIDPSLFSQALMFYASKAAASAPTDGNGAPNRILAEAFEHVLKEPLVVAGSATACILTMDASNGTLHSANLGDSGFVILRQGTGKHGVFHASPPQQLGFNTPLQLAKLPKEWIQEGSISNTPKDAAAWECTLQHGDLIIVGTDGLFDNVDAKIEIPQFAKFIKEKHHASYAARHAGADKPTDSLQEDREFVQVLATNLVEYAKICQNSTTKQSPFEREAARYGIHFPGGKIDDVAIVCCLVIER